MELKILSFEWESFLNKRVVSVTMLTWVGEITVLENHEPLMTYVEPSTLYVVFKDENDIDRRDDFAVWRWVVEVNGKEIKILTDMLTDIKDLDVDKIKRAKLKAKEIMEKYENSSDNVNMAKFIEAQDALLKSIAQLKLYDIKK